MWPVRHEAIFGSSFRLAPLAYRRPFLGSVCRTLAPFRSARYDHVVFALLISDPKPTSRSQSCRTSSNVASGERAAGQAVSRLGQTVKVAARNEGGAFNFRERVVLRRSARDCNPGVNGVLLLLRSTCALEGNHMALAEFQARVRQTENDPAISVHVVAPDEIARLPREDAEARLSALLNQVRVRPELILYGFRTLASYVDPPPREALLGHNTLVEISIPYTLHLPLLRERTASASRHPAMCARPVRFRHRLHVALKGGVSCRAIPTRARRAKHTCPSHRAPPATRSREPRHCVFRRSPRSVCRDSGRARLPQSAFRQRPSVRMGSRANAVSGPLAPACSAPIAPQPVPAGQ